MIALLCSLNFLGESSFAGMHDETEEHKVVLFDVSIYKKGFMFPKDFRKTFEDVVETPEMLYSGKANVPFQASVEASQLEGMSFEGVVCKSQELHRGRQILFKIKSDAWLDKLKTFTKGNTKLFNELA